MERLVTAIVPRDKKRSLVRFSDGAALPLYLGEIRRYHLAEGGPVSEETWLTLQKVLRHRVRERALYLIDRADRTAGELREKLIRDGYPEAFANEAVANAACYGFIDDERYARFYIQQKTGKKSVREMRRYLAAKHIPREVIDEALRETGTDDRTALRRLAEKKVAQVKPQTPEQWQKVLRYLAGHGYLYEDIRGVLDELRRESS